MLFSTHLFDIADDSEWLVYSSDLSDGYIELLRVPSHLFGRSGRYWMDECAVTSVVLLDGIQPPGILSNSHSISCDEADNLETIDSEVASIRLIG